MFILAARCNTCVIQCLDQFRVSNDIITDNDIIYFSEFALVKYRVFVEISYLIFLSQKTNLLRKLTTKEISILNNIAKNFSVQDGLQVKEFEKKINYRVY